MNSSKGNTGAPHPQDRVGRIYTIYREGRSMEARIVGFRWDPERRQTVFDAVDAANALEHMGVGERFTVAESRIGPERDSAYPGWLHNGPLSEDPVFIRVDFEDMTHKP